MPGSDKKIMLGKMLVDADLITQDQLNIALANQREWGGRIGSTLVNMGFIKEEKLGQFLSHQLNIPSIDIASIRIKKEAIELIPKELAEKYMMVPVAFQKRQDDTITKVLLAMSDPLDLNAVDEVQFSTGLKVKAGIAPEGAIWRAIQIYYYGNKAVCAKLDAPSSKIKIDTSDINESLEIFRGRDDGAEPTESIFDVESLEDIAKEVRALRNILVRNGVITITEFFNELKKFK
jgi:type IV pilus assembly protein PilB